MIESTARLSVLEKLIPRLVQISECEKVQKTTLGTSGTMQIKEADHEAIGFGITWFTGIKTHSFMDRERDDDSLIIDRYSGFNHDVLLFTDKVGIYSLPGLPGTMEVYNIGKGSITVDYDPCRENKDLTI